MNSRFWSLALALALSLGSLSAEAAKRMGGGKSMGQQSSNVTQREAARPATPAQAAPIAPAATPAAPAAAPAPAAARSEEHTSELQSH